MYQIVLPVYKIDDVDGRWWYVSEFFFVSFGCEGECAVVASSVIRTMESSS